jgi:hypothetical protein
MYQKLVGNSSRFIFKTIHFNYFQLDVSAKFMFYAGFIGFWVYVSHIALQCKVIDKRNNLV